MRRTASTVLEAAGPMQLLQPLIMVPDLLHASPRLPFVDHVARTSLRRHAPRYVFDKDFS